MVRFPCLPTRLSPLKLAPNSPPFEPAADMLALAPPTSAQRDHAPSCTHCEDTNVKGCSQKTATAGAGTSAAAHPTATHVTDRVRGPASATTGGGENKDSQNYTRE